jgi:transaldolase/glucose-6-phosphate isomerase
MVGDIANLRAFAGEIAAAGFRHVVLLGMGGSSLAPEVFQATFGNSAGYPELTVLDSTHPDAVGAVTSRIDLRRSVFLVSSKSGGTTETLSFFRHFWHALGAVSQSQGEHFVAITDPGTALVRLAGQRGFRRTVAAPVEVGGRYSALSVFGLVPAALIGCDLTGPASRAQRMAEACGPSVPVVEQPGLVLGAVLGEMALAGREKLTLITSPSLAALPSWIEQLIAESTGKNGRGIVPVCDEPIASPEAYGSDRVFVHLGLAADSSGGLDDQIAALENAGHPVVRIRLEDTDGVAAEFFRWEVATAAAGAVLGIHPFDQPDVQLAKDLARQAMAGGSGGRVAGAAVSSGEVGTTDDHTLRGALRAWISEIGPSDYVAVQAYLAPAPATHEALQRLRARLRDRLRVATTLGYGPRFLHSTGQLHKGGPAAGVFLQLVDEPARDLPVPETDYTFGELIRAQALGDLGALRQRGRRVLRVGLGRDAVEGVDRIIAVL